MVLAWLVNGFFALLVLSAAAYILHRRRGRKARKATRELVVSPLSGLVVGAVLLGFQAIFQPQVRHMIAEEQNEQALEDENGLELPGGALFHRQLWQIRRGEDTSDLTVHMDR
jgi:hypothetical protein